MCAASAVTPPVVPLWPKLLAPKEAQPSAKSNTLGVTLDWLADDWLLDTANELALSLTTELAATGALDAAALETGTLEAAALAGTLEAAVLDGAVLDGAGTTETLDCAEETVATELAATEDGKTAGADEVTTTGVLDATTDEGATDDTGALETITAVDDAIDAGAELEATLDTAGSLLGTDEPGGITTAELWLAALELWLTGTPTSSSVSCKCWRACSAEITAVFTEPELATKLVTAGSVSNCAGVRLKSTGAAAWLTAGLMVIPLDGSPSVSKVCSRRAMFITTGDAGSRVCAISRGVTMPLAGTGGNTRSPIKKVTVSPGK